MNNDNNKPAKITDWERMRIEGIKKANAKYAEPAKNWLDGIRKGMIDAAIDGAIDNLIKSGDLD